MLKGEDILLLLKLAADEERAWTVRQLEAETRIPRSVLQRGLGRLDEAGLVDKRRYLARLGPTEEFLLHGLRYVFPAVLGSETRGIPAAWATKPLSEEITATGPPPVWPHHHGQVRGLAIEPLSRHAINAAILDPRLAEDLALVDSLRAGDARVRGLAAKLLSDRLQGIPR